MSTKPSISQVLSDIKPEVERVLRIRGKNSKAVWEPASNGMRRDFGAICIARCPSEYDAKRVIDDRRFNLKINNSGLRMIQYGARPNVLIVCQIRQWQQNDCEVYTY